MIFGLNSKEVVARFSKIQGDLAVCRGLNFAQLIRGVRISKKEKPSFGIRKYKLSKKTPAACHFLYFHCKFSKLLPPFLISLQ